MSSFPAHARFMTLSLSAVVVGCTQPAPTTVTKPDVPNVAIAAVADACPEMEGVYIVESEGSLRDKVIQRRKVDETTTYTIDGTDFIADGKLRRPIGESRTTYVASCESKNLKIEISKIGENNIGDGVKYHQKSSFSKLTEEGDFKLDYVDADGKHSQVMLMKALPLLERPNHVVSECPKLGGTYIADDRKSFVVTETPVADGIRFEGIGGDASELSTGLIVDGKMHKLSDTIYSAVCSGEKILVQASQRAKHYGDVTIVREAEKLVILSSARGQGSAAVETSAYEVDQVAKDAETDAKIHAEDQCPTLNGSFHQTNTSDKIELSTERALGQPTLYKVSPAGVEIISADGVKYSATADGSNYQAFCVSQQLRIYLFEKGSAMVRMTFAPRGSVVQLSSTISNRTERVLLAPAPAKATSSCEYSSSPPCE